MKPERELTICADTAAIARFLAEAAVVGIEAERERCVDIAGRWMRTDHLKLHAGEMTAQEVRSVKAVLGAIIAEIVGGK